MAHNLSIEDGRASLMYVGKTPWHGLGTRLETPPETAAEVMRVANLAWEVGLKPVYCYDGDFFHEIPGKKAVVRLDKWGQPDCEPFNVVGDDYQVWQNADAFRVFDPIVETGSVSYHTAGALGKGERVWVLAQVEGRIRIKKTDEVEKYLLLSTGHDGRTSLQIRVTPVRVVCQNTLLAALFRGTNLFTIHHVRGMEKAVKAAEVALQRIFQEFTKLEQTYEQFAARSLVESQLTAYVSAVFPDPAPRKGQSQESYEAALRKNDELRKKAKRLFEEGIGNQAAAIKGTLWAAYNGITELIDHRTPYASPWQRFKSVLFTEGSKTKQRAFDEGRKLLAG